MAHAHDTAVTLDGVTKRFRHTAAVRDITFDVRPGEMFGLIGSDGAGKTTTIRLMAGLLRPDAGRIRVAGVDPVADHRTVTKQVGYLSQRFSLYGDLSIDENIAFFADIHRVRDYAARRDRLLELTQLQPFRHRLAERLSGGMKQKLALVCTLVHEPRLLLLDEPTTGVDPVARREFWKLLSELVSQGISIVMATPYLDEAERCSRVALLHGGRLLAVDRPATLKQRFDGHVIEIVARPHRDVAAFLGRTAEFADHHTFGERIHVRVRTTDATEVTTRLQTALIAQRFEVESVRLVPATLEDVFIDRLLAGEEPTQVVA